MLANKLLMATSGSASDKLYVDDVFSTYLYTGNGSTQTINNGMDLLNKGGLVWTKSRNSGGEWGDDHWLVYSRLLPANDWSDLYNLKSNLTSEGMYSGSTIDYFTSSGYHIASASWGFNETDKNYASWTFRRAPKFFDIVTYTGDGVAGRQIPHALGIDPGWIIVKRTDAAASWLGNFSGYVGSLNSTAAMVYAGPVANASWFMPAGAMDNGPTAIRGNELGSQYVAYLFAHDPSADGIIQCGSFTTDGSGNAAVNLGWEPQYLLLKNRAVGSGASTSNWFVLDVLRGMGVSDKSDSSLYPNLADAEQGAMNVANPTATGFTVLSNPSSTGIYLAIRRPNKPPTSGTEVYNAIARTGTNSVPWKASGAGFPPDMTIMSGRDANAMTNLSSYQHSVIDRLRRATEHIQTSDTSGEEGGWGAGHIHNMDGYDGLYSDDPIYYNVSGGSYVDFHFRRAPGFFDVVCYTGTGVARTVPHSLGVAPELMIVKSRISNTSDGWGTYHAALGPTKNTFLERTNPPYTNTVYWNDTTPTASVFTVGSGVLANQAGSTYVAYLFATKAGISKVGSYTGNGTTQTINCGFTTGARFILIKRTDSTGDWHIWDTARGIVSANDPHLSLNTTAAEVTTDDSVDPEASGFIVNQNAATNINVSGANYIFLSIA